jgi:hypothetical protein
MKSKTHTIIHCDCLSSVNQKCFTNTSIIVSFANKSFYVKDKDSRIEVHLHKKSIEKLIESLEKLKAIIRY